MSSITLSGTVLAVLFFALPGFTLAQTLEPGPQVLTFYSEVDDSEQPYAIYLPPDFDESRRYPLVVSLHGAGSNHRLNLRRVFGKSNAEGENDVEASRYFPEWDDVEYIVASPFARGTMGYQGVAEKDVYDVLADVKRRFPVDGDRVYLTGLSMGGGGTLWLGLTRPDIWAAIAPVCPAPPEGTRALAGNALNMPVRIHQGGADPVVRPEGVREWVARLEDLGAQVEYEEYPGVGHDSWVQAYADGRVFDWFDQFERDPFPSRVRFSSDRYKYDTAYWVRLDALTPGQIAEIDVRLTTNNRIEAVTSNLDGFTLDLAGHPSYDASAGGVAVVDGAEILLPPTGAASFSRGDSGWMSGRAVAGAKRAGVEGPMSEAFAGRHIYVYGTADGPSEEVEQARYAEAIKAAEWSVYRGPFRGRVMVFPRIVADRDVRPSDLETSNLVLFGTRETNSAIERFADRLPLHLDGAPDDRGLVYVYPIDGRYVLVNSGRPWWEIDGDGSPFTSAVPAFALNGRGDYLLFDGTDGQVVAEGQFDGEWRLSDEEVTELEQRGVEVTQDASTGSR